MRFRQVHLDFHTFDSIDGIGAKFNKKQFQDALEKGCVDSITVFAKCHHGWMYYPAETTPMHPNLNFDLLAAQIEAANEIDVKTPIYISAGIDERIAREHTDWLVRNKDDGTLWTNSFTAPGFHLLCFNSPYLEVLLNQIRETITRFDGNGIFLDITSITPCY